MQSGDSCCWICNECRPWQYVKNEMCVDCGEGRWPNDDKLSCYTLPQQYMEWNSIFSIIPIVIAVIGIFLTLFVIYTFMKFMDTPIVKASGRELSFILLGGIMFCYVLTFILLAKPSTIICALQRFGVSFFFQNFNFIMFLKPSNFEILYDKNFKKYMFGSEVNSTFETIFLLSLTRVEVVSLLR